MKKFAFIFLIILMISSCCFGLEINSPSAILIENETGRILYQKYIYSKAFPASTTKIMTAILTLEKLQLDEKIVVSQTAVNAVPPGGSNVALQPGEEISVRDLLRGLLIVSGNETANVLAERISGSTEEFAKLMNQRAKELGCKNSHFVNANGLHDDNHYSCAYDLVTLYQYAYSNFPDFKSIIAEKTFSLPDSQIYTKSDRTFNNTNKLISDQSKYYYEYCTGGKTGYTKEAKNCLVSSATKDGITLFACILGATQDDSNNSYRYEDTIALFDYGFSQIKRKDIIKENDVVRTIQILNAKKDNNNLILLAENTINVPTLVENYEQTYEPQLLFSGDVLAPISSRRQNWNRNIYR